MKLGFSDAVALPGSTVHLHLQAAPGSLCSIRAVDKSVLLLRPEAELSRDSVSHFSADRGWLIRHGGYTDKYLNGVGACFKEKK